MSTQGYFEILSLLVPIAHLSNSDVLKVVDCNLNKRCHSWSLIFAVFSEKITDSKKLRHQKEPLN